MYIPRTEGWPRGHYWVSVELWHAAKVTTPILEKPPRVWNEAVMGGEGGRLQTGGQLFSCNLAVCLRAENSGKQDT